VLLGPAHLVPVGFWQAAKLLLDPNGCFGADSASCLQVPVVTTVPVTQVKLLIAIIACVALSFCNYLMMNKQEQLVEWGKTWPISHRQPGAVLPPPPLTREQSDIMYLPRELFQLHADACFIRPGLTPSLFRQRNMNTLVSKVRAAGGCCGVAVVNPTIADAEGQ
jgi:hypothetical protein